MVIFSRLLQANAVEPMVRSDEGSLTLLYPALTQGEKRLCCLLSLDMDAKQMARLLMIQPDSVKKTRHRLRRKLGMKPDETFTSFFSSL